MRFRGLLGSLNFPKSLQAMLSNHLYTSIQCGVYQRQPLHLMYFCSLQHLAR